MQVGVAVVDITPPPGLAMAGFGVRTEPAVGAHDPLTVRAIVIDDVAIVCVDVLGLDRETVMHIRERCSLPADRVIVTALHTHGGPETLASRRHPGLDRTFLSNMKAACIHAIDTAVASRRPALLNAGNGCDPEVAKNRRHPGGITDPSLPVLEFSDTFGNVIATVVAYACHPVALGPDNRLWTADYPASVRRQLELRSPGSVSIFLTGCAGDANSGHPAHASNTLDPSRARTFERAESLATRIVNSTTKAPLAPVSGTLAIAGQEVLLGFERREQGSLEDLIRGWKQDLETSPPAQRIILEAWIAWAHQALHHPIEGLTIAVRVTALRLGQLELVALPGEIFAETAHTIRRRIGNRAALVIGFADDSPGYIAPSSEYAHGGYEIDEAHRYYGMPATFALGCAERLADLAVHLIFQIRSENGLPQSSLRN
jgi:neutral ceramidase